MAPQKWRLIAPVALLLGLIGSYFILFPWSPLPQEHNNGNSTLNRTFRTSDVPDAPSHLPVIHGSTDVTLRLQPEQQAFRQTRALELDWNVTQDLRRPDGVARQVYLINGQFPAPTVECRSGDELLLTVRNQLINESFALHWHGLRLSNDQNGVAGLTQCSIGPGQTFTYRLQIADGQAGTFWWYSSSALQQTDGLCGPIIVHRAAQGQDHVSDAEELGYDDEQVLSVTDWYHASAREVFDWYTDWRNLAMDPTPDSLLLNGKGYFACPAEKPGLQPLDCQNVDVPFLTFPTMRTRLRIINTGASSGISVSTSGYVFRLISIDGGNRVQDANSYSQKIGIIHPGERVDLIVEREAHYSGTGWITISINRRTMQLRNMALTAIQQFPIYPTVESQDHMPLRAASEDARLEAATIKEIKLAKVRGLSSTMEEIPAADHTVVLDAMVHPPDGYQDKAKGLINETSWAPPQPTALPLLALDKAEWPADQQSLATRFRRDEWVDLVLRSFDDNGHAFYLQGHEFFVLYIYDPLEHVDNADNSVFADISPGDTGPNMIDPATKDTIFVPAKGYAVVRFQASNPGLWLLSCQNTWHQAIGMSMVLEVVGDDDEEMSELKDLARISCVG